MHEVTDMTIPCWNRIRAAACTIPLLLAGCVVVPDGSDGYHGSYPAPSISASVYSNGIYSTYGSSRYVRPPAPVYHIHRPRRR
jgi:hypothetical protein